MKVIGNLLIGISVVALAACSTPAPQVAAADGAKPVTAKCNRVVDVPIGGLMKKDCSAPTGEHTVDKQEFMNSLQTPGAVPQR